MPDLAAGTNQTLLDEAFVTRGRGKATFEYAAYELEARDPKSTGTKPRRVQSSAPGEGFMSKRGARACSQLRQPDESASEMDEGQE
jgi:hypothetical protein